MEDRFFESDFFGEIGFPDHLDSPRLRDKDGKFRSDFSLDIERMIGRENRPLKIKTF